MLLEIVKYGSAVLREKAVPVPAVTPELVRLAESMLQTMYHAKGVGLAAQQVGRCESVCVIDVPASCEESEDVKAFNARVKMPLVMFNPVIISKDGSQEGKEGCLSFPNMGGRVVRADQVTCQYADVSGRMQIITVRGGARVPRAGRAARDRPLERRPVRGSHERGRQARACGQTQETCEEERR